MAYMSNDPLAQAIDEAAVVTVAKNKHSGESPQNITTRYHGKGLYLLPILFPDWK